MPLPRIRDGKKLSLMLPAEAVDRIKAEAQQKGTVPAVLLLKVLEQYWGGENEASCPTIPHTTHNPKPPTTQERKRLVRMLTYLEGLIDQEALTANEIAKAVGVRTRGLRQSWTNLGYLPKAQLEPIAHLLRAKGLPVIPR